MKLCACFVAAAAGLVAGQQTRLGVPIRGVVIDAVDTRPVEGVQVTLIQRRSGRQWILDERASTNERGEFELHAPIAGEYDLSASGSRAFGHYGRDAFSDVAQKWFRVAGPISGIVVKLWRSPTVTGTVRDESGEPLAGATVLLLQNGVLGGHEVLRTRGRGVSDARGQYTLEPVYPGKYLAMASARAVDGGAARPAQYYFDSRSATLATPLELQPSGVTRGIDFELKRERGFVVSGELRVPDRPSGADLVDLLVPVDTRPGAGMRVATATVKGGRFSFPAVVAGTYEVRFVRYPSPPEDARVEGVARSTGQPSFPGERLAAVPGGPTWWASERVDVVDRDVPTTLGGRQGVRVSGQFVFSGQASKPEPSVIQNRGVYLRGVDYHAFFQSAPLGPAREDGSFSTVAVPPGRYVLGLLSSFDGYQLTSVRVGGREVAGISFELNADVEDAVLTFSPRTTAVTGQVAGEPGQNRFVLVWPMDETLWTGSGTEMGRIYRTVTDDGRYMMRLFPGTYRVVAMPGAPPPEWESPAYLRTLVVSSARVVVPSGQTVVYNLPLTARK